MMIDPRMMAGVSDTAIRVVLILAVLAGAAWTGYQYRDARADAQIAGMQMDIVDAQVKAVQESARATKAMQGKADAIAQAVLADMDKIDAQRKLAEKELDRYEETDNADCTADDGWMRTVDASLPDATGPAAGADARADTVAAITNGDTARIIQYNYLACQADQARLRRWQEFYTDVQAEYQPKPWYKTLF